MENLNLYVEYEDILNYFLHHKEEKNLKYKEALFIKYLEDNSFNDYEKKEKIGLHIDFPCDNFETYINNLKEKHNPDISDISLILVPALGLNKLYTGDTNTKLNYINNYTGLLDDSADIEKVITETIYRLRDISDEYTNNHSDIDYPIKQIGIFNDTLERYVILRKKGIIDYNNDFSLIGIDRCNKELDIYKDIYGSDTIETIKEYTKELKRNYL